VVAASVEKHILERSAPLLAARESPGKRDPVLRPQTHGQSMANGVATRALLSGIRYRPRAFERISSIGLELFEGRHASFSIGFVS
jgi:hypothetical protein